MISVLLVDDQAMLRMGFRLILEAEADIEVIGEAADGASGLKMVSALHPDVVLMDIRMPTMNGIDATAAITRTDASTKVLILTTYDLDEYVFDGLRAGASGFLLKDAAPGDLLTAIRTIAAGDAVLAPSTTRRLIDQFMPLLPDARRQQRRDQLFERLTDRERAVFAQLASGRSNREIAADFHLAEGTIKIHVGRVLAKLDANAPHEALLVLDGTTGQNAINQTRQFRAAIGVTGLVVTKLDGTAKGGVVFALAKEFGVPIRFVGLGETADDLREFDAAAFVDGLLPATLGNAAG